MKKLFLMIIITLLPLLGIGSVKFPIIFIRNKKIVVSEVKEIPEHFTLKYKKELYEGYYLDNERGPVLINVITGEILEFYSVENMLIYFIYLK